MGVLRAEEQQGRFAGSGTAIVFRQVTVSGASFTPSVSCVGFWLTGLVKFHTGAYELVSMTLLAKTSDKL